MYYLLLFHDNDVCTNAPRYSIARRLPVLLNIKPGASKIKISRINRFNIHVVGQRLTHCTKITCRSVSRFALNITWTIQT
jgi:hypothetical protein